jgi:hypothetical protein
VTTIDMQAITAVRQARTDRPESSRLWATKLYRDATGSDLATALAAVGQAIEQVKVLDLEACRVPADFGWRYEFPNGYEASVINDPHRPFRFEVLSDDPADAASGYVVGGLTSEQVEDKLTAIASLPTR